MGRKQGPDSYNKSSCVWVSFLLGVLFRRCVLCPRGARLTILVHGWRYFSRGVSWHEQGGMGYTRNMIDAGKAGSKTADAEWGALDGSMSKIKKHLGHIIYTLIR